MPKSFGGTQVAKRQATRQTKGGVKKRTTQHKKKAVAKRATQEDVQAVDSASLDAECVRVALFCVTRDQVQPSSLEGRAQRNSVLANIRRISRELRDEVDSWRLANAQRLEVYNGTISVRAQHLLVRLKSLVYALGGKGAGGHNSVAALPYTDLRLNEITSLEVLDVKGFLWHSGTPHPTDLMRQQLPPPLPSTLLVLTLTVPLTDADGARLAFVLSGLRKLQCLHLTTQHWEEQDQQASTPSVLAHALSQLTSLTHFVHNNNNGYIKADEWEALGKLPRLKVLSLSSLGMQLPAQANPSAFNSLQSLSLISSKPEFDTKVLMAVGDLKSLTSFNGSVLAPGSFQPLGAMLRHWGTRLVHMQQLRLEGFWGLQNEDMEVLAQHMRQLRHLAVQHKDLTRAVVPTLACLPSMQCLEVQHNGSPFQRCAHISLSRQDMSKLRAYLQGGDQVAPHVRLMLC